MKFDLNKFSKILILICIFNLFISAFLFIRSRTVLFINSSNRDIITNYLNNKISNQKSITKVSYDRVWHEGTIYIYFNTGALEKFPTYDSTIQVDELIKYIKEHGYKETDIAKIIFIISLLAIIIFYICLYIFI